MPWVIRYVALVMYDLQITVLRTICIVRMVQRGLNTNEYDRHIFEKLYYLPQYLAHSKNIYKAVSSKEELIS